MFFHDQNICILNVLNSEYSCVYFFTYLTCFLEVSDDLIKNLEDCKKNGKHERQYKNTIGALARSPYPHERKRQVFRKMELKVGRSRPRNISRRINAQE